MKGTSLLQRLTKSVPRKSGLIQLYLPLQAHCSQVSVTVPILHIKHGTEVPQATRLEGKGAQMPPCSWSGY